jgi:hypothetical protein
MNPFRSVLNALGWTSSPTHENHTWLWLMLNFAADEFDAHSESTTFADPFREVLHRFEAYPGPAYTSMQQILSGRIR